MSKVQICNRALTTYLGAGRITSLSEDTPAAEQCNIHYDDTVRLVFERVWWNFASARQLLAQLTNDRTTEWGFKYAVPADALAIRWVNDKDVATGNIRQGISPDADREIAGAFIYSDVEGATCAFTREITDPLLFPQYFREAVSSHLAAAICLPITQDRTRTQAAHQMAESTLSVSISLDMRNSPQAPQGSPDYMRARGVT